MNFTTSVLVKLEDELTVILVVVLFIKLLVVVDSTDVLLANDVDNVSCPSIRFGMYIEIAKVRKKLNFKILIYEIDLRALLISGKKIKKYDFSF